MTTRRSPLDRRLEIQTRIQVRVEDELIWLETMNLGLGGSYCRSRVSLPMKATVPCRIWLRKEGKGATVKVQALVLRSEFRPDGYRIALRFTKMEKMGREKLRNFLADKGLGD